MADISNPYGEKARPRPGDVLGGGSDPIMDQGPDQGPGPDTPGPGPRPEDDSDSGGLDISGLVSSGNFSGSDKLPGVRGESSSHLKSTGGRGGSDLSNMSSSAAWRSTNKDFGRGRNPREVPGGYANRAFGMGRKRETFEDVEQKRRGEERPGKALGMGDLTSGEGFGMGRSKFKQRMGMSDVIADTTPEVERKKSMPTPPPSDTATPTTERKGPRANTAKRLG